MDYIDPEYEYDDDRPWIGMALSLVLVLVVLVVAFVWFVIQFDPLTSDFIQSDAPVATATAIPDQTPAQN